MTTLDQARAEAARIRAEDAVWRGTVAVADPRAIVAITTTARDEANADWRADPAKMAATLTKGEFKDWPYVKLLSDQIVKAATGVSRRQIWNLPSRYGKTLMVKWGCVWILDRTDGRAKIAIVSYGHSLARETSADVRDLLLYHAADLRGQLLIDRRRADRLVTNNGGGLLGSGIDGGIIGFGVGGGLAVPTADGEEQWIRGGVFLDDPFKNWQEAHSEAQRDHVENQFRAVIRSRLDEEEAFIVVLHHRMHADDLTDRLLDDTLNDTGDDWEHVCLPALAYDDGTPDPLGREPGQPLEPRRYSLEACISRAQGMGPYLAAAMEQQRPTPEEGNELLRSWFVLATESELPRVPDNAVTSWDLKLKNREAGDYVVGQAWWAVGEARFLMDQLRGQYDHATTENAIALLAVRNPQAKVHIVESAGSADEVVPELKRPIAGYLLPQEIGDRLGMSGPEREKVQRLRRQGMGNIKMEPATEGSKQVRARESIAPPAAVGNVRFPASAPWVPALLDELAAFPNGAYDDQVDAMSQALKRLRTKVTRPGARRPTGRILR